jgi:hypothetical protein
MKTGHEDSKLQNIDVGINFLKQKLKINKRIDGKNQNINIWSLVAIHLIAAKHAHNISLFPV